MARTSNGTDAKTIRCAIYTRKSTDEGLNQEFNSLDAQREAAEAYILSQAGEGWTCLPDRFDDGGYTGANMERPALKQLLAEIERGRLDCVVVYKVDRLSRSIRDFARMMELFEKHGISFVSVTQQFNTTNSLGRLTLNILLSFAQFEREIISERTRDKQVAARKKGKWTGGHLILGYDLDAAAGRLVINDEEAERVRSIFDWYLAGEPITRITQKAQKLGWRNKQWVTREGNTYGGHALRRTHLYNLLANPLYAGRIRADGNTINYPPEGAVQVGRLGKQCQLLNLMTDPRRTRRTPVRRSTYVLIEGLQTVGDFGQHLEGEIVPQGFGISGCLSALQVVEQLTVDLQPN